MPSKAGPPSGSSTPFGCEAPAGVVTLRRQIGLGQGVALYVSAVVGAGVLVLPGQTAGLAGPASLVAWGFSCLLGVLLAATFAVLASRRPDAGGVATYTTEAFGGGVGGVTGWWYLVAGSVGQTVVPLTGGYYLADALGVDPHWAYLVAAGILVVALCVNLAGIRVSAGVQVALAMAVAAVFSAAALTGITHPVAHPFSPFAPHGLGGIGEAVVVLFFAFAGWEAVAHLAAEFRDPERDLPKATAITVGLVSVLYLGIAAAVVATRSYGTAEPPSNRDGVVRRGPIRARDGREPELTGSARRVCRSVLTVWLIRVAGGRWRLARVLRGGTRRRRRRLAGRRG